MDKPETVIIEVRHINAPPMANPLRFVFRADLAEDALARLRAAGMEPLSLKKPEK